MIRGCPVTLNINEVIVTYVFSLYFTVLTTNLKYLFFTCNCVISAFVKKLQLCYNPFFQQDLCNYADPLQYLKLYKSRDKGHDLYTYVYYCGLILNCLALSPPVVVAFVLGVCEMEVQNIFLLLDARHLLILIYYRINSFS
jgi:hypothetical protein